MLYRHLRFLTFLAFLVQLLFACGSNEQTEGSLSIPTNAETISQGEQLFLANCSACHNFRQRGIGPNLSGVTKQAEAEWLFQFIHNAPQMINAGDERSTALYEEYQTYMPAFTQLDTTEIEAILAYMHTHQDTMRVAQTAADLGEPLENPIPQQIEHSGLQLVVEEVATAPATRENPPLARINKMLAFGGKLYIHDLQGVLYQLKDGGFHIFLDIRAEKEDFVDKPGLGTGLGSFDFHPEYEQNGLFYTTHTEPAGTATADFSYNDSIPVALQWVLTEWKMDDPAADQFVGSSREMLRINMVSGVHGMQELTFNPIAQAGDADYGLLYLSVGEGGAVINGYPQLCQDDELPWGSILRLDPQGSNSKNGQYGIPADNPYVNHPTALKEIFAYGFRNPHRISWDTGGDHKMLISGIGQKNAEEINLGVAGANYGWCVREGTFVINPDGNIDLPYPLPENDDAYGFTYPVAQYDHDEGAAISGGFVYRGEQVPELAGKYVFGDIVTGRLFMVDSEKLALGSQQPIYELGLQANGKTTNWRELSGNNRVDLRFGLGVDNELYIFTKADGKLWKVVDVAQTSEATARADF
jgi:mono/diheme cytochrome c family protein